MSWKSAHETSGLTDGNSPLGAGRLNQSLLPLEPLLVQPLSGAKRAVDLVASFLAITLLSPLLLLIAVSIKLTSGGPVIFVQPRTGQGLQRFNMYKFRTMIRGAEQDVEQVRRLNEMSGPLTKIRRDPRCTKIGRILRRTSLDELPQLLNVLKGDMTLIGPRAFRLCHQHTRSGSYGDFM